MGDGRRVASGWTVWPTQGSNRAWFACLLLAMLTAIASQFYLPLVEGPGVTKFTTLMANESDGGVFTFGYDSYGANPPPEPNFLVPDLRPFTDSRFLFWLVALPSAYLLVTGITVITRRARGEKPHARTFIGTAAACAVVLAIDLGCAATTGMFSLRGMFPLVLIAIGVVFLALIERSIALLIGSTILLAIAILATRINFAHFEVGVWELGFNIHLNVVAVAVGLLAIGAALLFRRIRSARPNPS